MITDRMYDRDGVLRACADAARLSATEIRQALTDLTLAPNEAARDLAEARLRDACVTLAAGVEAGSHDGGTFAARVKAAERALLAWDGPADCEIRIAGRIVPCTWLSAQRAGWQVMLGEPRRYAERAQHDRAERDLLTALNEGYRGEAAVCRAIVLSSAARDARDTRDSAEKVAQAEEKAAGMRLAAEREVTRRAK